jgi:phospholipase/lecithinase/hemolysin
MPIPQRPVSCSSLSGYGNLPNVGQTPAFIGTPAGYSNYMDSKVAAFNTMLASAVTNVIDHNPGSRIYLGDNNLAFSRILSAPASYGFTVSPIGALEDPNLTWP